MNDNNAPVNYPPLRSAINATFKYIFLTDKPSDLCNRYGVRVVNNNHTHMAEGWCGHKRYFRCIIGYGQTSQQAIRRALQMETDLRHHMTNWFVSWSELPTLINGDLQPVLLVKYPEAGRTDQRIRAYLYVEFKPKKVYMAHCYQE